MVKLFSVELIALFSYNRDNHIKKESRDYSFSDFKRSTIYFLIKSFINLYMTAVFELVTHGMK